MENQDPLGKRLSRFIILLGLIFSITMAVVVGQRLSTDALSLLIGLACGIATTLPMLLMGLWIWRRQEERLQTRQLNQPAPSAVQPPAIIMVAPPTLPGYAPQWQALNDESPARAGWETAPAPRKFTIVGGEE